MWIEKSQPDNRIELGIDSDNTTISGIVLMWYANSENDLAGYNIYRGQDSNGTTIEFENLAKAEKNKESYTTRDKNNKFKYEVTDSELKSKYKFDADMIKTYRAIRGTLDAAGDMWNKTVKKSTGSSNKSSIEKLPNYMPHVFKGDFRIWINKIDPNTNKTKPIAAYSANNKLGVSIVKSRLKKDKPEYFDETKYEIITRKIKRSAYGKFEVDSFIDSLRTLDLKNMQGELSTLQKALYEYGKAGFEKFTRQRQGIDNNFEEVIETMEELIENEGFTLPEQKKDIIAESIGDLAPKAIA